MKIEFSPGFSSGLVSRIARLSDAYHSTNGPVYNTDEDKAKVGFLTFGYTSSGYYTSYFNIMKGTMPSTISALPTTFPTASSLIQWQGTNSHFVSSVITNNILRVETPYLTASASGIAEWFWVNVREFNGTNGIIHSIIGTVGGPGSGADLEIASTNIVSGDSYRISNLRLRFPTSWVF